ncbi:MAG: cytochrome c [Magnetospirillum sp.]|nr:cytochrome c [Magnetospirillum sp.]
MPRAILALALILAAASAHADGGIGQTRIKELQALVEQDCGSCHGLSRQGGLGSPLTPDALAGKPAEALAFAILDGRPGTPMPPWRGLVSESEAEWIARMLKGEADNVR